MKYKSFLISLLLVSFCSGEETQAEICDWYLTLVEDEMTLEYEKLIRDFNRTTEMYGANELSEAIAKSTYSIGGEFYDELEDIIEDFNELIPNEDNISNNKEIIKNLRDMQTALEDMKQWVETKDVAYASSGLQAIQKADQNIVNIYNNLTCPTD